jgi:arginase
MRIKIVTSMSELGAGTRGASLGFSALIGAGHKKGNPILSKYPTEHIATSNEILFKEEEFKTAKRISGIAKMYNRIEERIALVIKEKNFPVVVSGDHSNAGGTIAGLKKAYPNKRLGVVWIDAHADLHSPYTSPTGNVHGMPLATALSEDNPEMAFKQPEDETIRFWNEMKGDKGPRLQADDLVFVSVRDTETPEEHLMTKYGIVNHRTDDVREKGVQQIHKEIMSRLEACDVIYVSFDVDSLDSSLSVGTGTPVAHGLMKSEAMDLIQLLVREEKCCCFEMVEINPLLDKNANSMGEMAFDILNSTLATLEERK